MRYTERQLSSDLLDQPWFSAEPGKIVICSTPRSGSYMLCRYMANAGLGVPHEYFNPIIIRQMAPRFGLAEDLQGLKWRRRTPLDRLPFGAPARGRAAEVAFLSKYVAALVPRRCQGGVFAAKVHFDQFLKVLDNPVGRKLLDGSLFIHLFRHDLLAQAVSTHFANLTGRWDIDENVTTAPAEKPDFFDCQAIDQTVQGLADADRDWRLFLAREGVAAMSVAYEDLCRDPFGFVVAVAERVGLDPTALRFGYSEAGSGAYHDPTLPSKRDVVERYVATVGNPRSYRQVSFEAGWPAIAHRVGSA
jgi:LPS sulfotransferase NodH